MSEYIVEAIQKGILETLEMTFFSALISYLIGLPEDPNYDLYCLACKF